jgi:hypothetical protein
MGYTASSVSKLMDKRIWWNVLEGRAATVWEVEEGIHGLKMASCKLSGTEKKSVERFLKFGERSEILSLVVDKLKKFSNMKQLIESDTENRAGVESLRYCCEYVVLNYSRAKHSEYRDAHESCVRLRRGYKVETEDRIKIREFYDFLKSNVLETKGIDGEDISKECIAIIKNHKFDGKAIQGIAITLRKRGFRNPSDKQRTAILDCYNRMIKEEESAKEVKPFISTLMKKVEKENIAGEKDIVEELFG